MSNRAQVSYNVIGTPAAPVTLTNAFTGNIGKAILAKDFKKLGLNWAYTPGESNAYAILCLEYSNDPIESTPSNWYDFTTSVPATTEVDTYGASGSEMAGEGTGIFIPAPNTSTVSTAVKNHIMPDTDLVANWVRVKAKEKYITTAGTLYVGMSLQS